MSTKELKLIVLSLELKKEFCGFAAEYAAAGEKVYAEMYARGIEDFAGYLRMMVEHSLGRNLPSDWVPSSTFWLVDNERRLLGCSRIRHELGTDFLKYHGGHIGYDIRPSQRGRGYGGVILGLAIEKARQIGLNRVLVTCEADNTASRRIIESHGGKFASLHIPDWPGKPVRRYWISI